MQRRSFLAALAGSVVARRLPKPDPAPEMNRVTTVNRPSDSVRLPVGAPLRIHVIEDWGASGENRFRDFWL